MPHPFVLPQAVTRALTALVGPSHVLLDPPLRAGYERDWTGRFGGPAAAVVRPGSAHELAEVLHTCARARVPLVIQGGNTGLVGGGVPRGGEVVVSTRRLDAVGPVDAAESRVAVGAGATLARVAEAAGRARLDVGIDLAARDAATIGGLVATDAGGLLSIAHGAMADQVIGLEVATLDGRRLPADPRVIAGSEGTLAAIVGVTLRLVPRLPGVAVAFVALDSVGDAVRLVADVRAGVTSLTAAELVLDDGLRLAARHLGVDVPFGATPPAAVLLECRAAIDPLDELAAALDDRPGIREVLVGADAIDRRRLWALREAHSEAVSTLGVPHKLDVVVPDAALTAFLERVGSVARAVDEAARVIVYGHLGVGDLHVNVIGPAPDDERVDDAVLGLVAEVGGDVTGEHGAGIQKAAWLRRTRPPEELAAIDATKRAWDPHGLLNPGVIPVTRAVESASPTVEPASSTIPG